MLFSALLHSAIPIFPFQMSNITVTYRDGRVAQLEQVYIRGSKIRFLILPDMLKNAPMLKSMKNKNQGSGAGRGKAAILKAQGEYLSMCNSRNQEKGYELERIFSVGEGFSASCTGASPFLLPLHQDTVPLPICYIAFLFCFPGPCPK